MYLPIVSCTNNWIVIKWNRIHWYGCALCSKCWMDSVTSGPDTTHTCRLCLAKKGSGAAVGVGEFSGSSPHTTAPLSACLVSPERGGGDACSADMSVSAAHFQITLSVCADMGRSVWTWLAAEWQGLVLKAGMLVRCSTIPQKPCGTNLLKCVRINMMQVP